MDTYQPTNTDTYQLTNMDTYQPTNMDTYQLTNMDAYQLTSSDHQTCSCPQAQFSLLSGYSAVLHVRSVLLSIPDCSIWYLDTNSQTNWNSNVLNTARNCLNKNSGLPGCDIMLMGKWLLTLERDTHCGFICGVQQYNRVLTGSYWMIVASPLDRWQ
jgi:hypothetical protein